MSDRLTLKTANPAGRNELLVEDSRVAPGGAFLAIPALGLGGVHLSGKDIAKLIDRLEPLAKRPTALDIFDELPIGATFKLEDDSDLRVKVSNARYIVTSIDHRGTYYSHSPATNGWAFKPTSYVIPTASA